MKDFALLNLVGAARPFLDALELIRKFSNSDATVLIQGETGTGKEVAARAIHYLGVRRDFPFVAINCGALPEGLIESEFFGHARGAFTDAREAKQGLVGQARGGTLFLDEVEALPLRAQIALLRFLQDKEYRPIGGPTIQNANVRIIGASNAQLSTLVRQGQFRSDLLFRLNVLPLHLPALRERAGDVLLLANAFLNRLNNQSNAPPKTLDPVSCPVLSAHAWPGNVRELENLIQREFVLAADSPIIRIDAVAEDAASSCPLRSSTADEAFKVAKARAVAQFEQAYLVALLEKTRGNLSWAARISGKDRSDIARLLRKHGLQRHEFIQRP